MFHTKFNIISPSICLFIFSYKLKTFLILILYSVKNTYYIYIIQDIKMIYNNLVCYTSISLDYNKNARNFKRTKLYHNKYFQFNFDIKLYLKLSNFIINYKLFYNVTLVTLVSRFSCTSPFAPIINHSYSYLFYYTPRYMFSIYISMVIEIYETIYTNGYSIITTLSFYNTITL